MASTADLYGRLQREAQAEQARGEQTLRRMRRGNNPYMAGPEPERRTYADPTADEAIGNVDRERQGRSGWS